MAIGNLKERLRSKFSRRFSTSSSLSSATSVDPGERKKTRSLKSRSSQRPSSTYETAEKDGDGNVQGVVQSEISKLEIEDGEGGAQLNKGSSKDLHEIDIQHQHLQTHDDNDKKHDSTSTGDFPTPNTTEFPPVLEEDENEPLPSADNIAIELSGPTPDSTTSPQPQLSRRQSLLPQQQTRLIKTLLETELPQEAREANLEFFAHGGAPAIIANMVTRKVWVKRPNASATLVTVQEDDLVDDVRDTILRKYANSLGRTFDAPDVILRIIPRENRQERVLGPEEPMGRTLDAYFPGGQTIEEALVIDVPPRRTPKPSPRPNGLFYDDRPLEAGSDYFPPMPVAPSMPSPRTASAIPVNGQPAVHHPPLSHSMSVLTTGHVPNLPSPGSARRHNMRPRAGRTHTSSPTVLAGQTQPHASLHNEQSLNTGAPPPAPLAPPLPTPPPLTQSDLGTQIQRVATPPPARVSSPRPSRPKKANKKANVDHPSLPAGMLNGAVPPINVLIVEDNIINLKLLEAFMKRLKVRWQTAMNGREAITKWRSGGFHLVLMDIQLPIMSGLEATKNIRRLERLNSIGVFTSSASSSAPSEQEGGEPEEEDKLPSDVLFKSPVIIVALTASSLQSDRHEALAAGCNDFLTKPVNFVWLERKVMEWGCMQALIDFDGWRKWKDLNQLNGDEGAGTEKKKTTTKKKAKDRKSLGSNSGAASSRVTIPEGDEHDQNVNS